MRRSHKWVMVFLIGYCDTQWLQLLSWAIVMTLQGGDHVTWSCDLFPMVRSCDYVIRSHDFFPTVTWPVLHGQKIWLCNQVRWSNSHGHVTCSHSRLCDYVIKSRDFSHSHMTYSCGQKIDYVIRSCDQVPTVMWPGPYGQVGNWTHNPDWGVGLHNLFLNARKIRKILKKFQKIFEKF